MIVTATGRWTFTASGASGSFAIPAPVYDTDALALYAVNTTTGEIYTPTSTVTLATDRSGATVTVASGLTAGHKVVVYRTAKRTQLQQLTPSGPFPAVATERSLDRAFADIQALYERVRHAVRFPLADDDGASELAIATARAGMVLGFDSAGQPALLANVPVSPAITLGAFWQTALLAGTQSLARTALDVPSNAAVTAAIAAQAVLDAAAIAAVNVAGRRNVLTNGDFAIDQEHEGASQTLTAAAAAAYVVDQWYASCTGANITVQRVVGTAPNQFALRFTGAASNTGFLLGQPIAAADIAHLASGDVALSLQVKSSSLTSLAWKAYYANAADTFAAKTLIASGTITGITSALATKSITFNAGANAANGVAIEFEGGALGATQTVQVEVVQLERGTVASPFERRSIRERFADCQRFYQKSYDLGVALATDTAVGLVGGTNGNGAANAMVAVPFCVPMRVAPSAIAYWDKAGNASKFSSSDFNVLGNNVAGLTIQAAGTRGFQAYQAVRNNHFFHFAATARF